MTRNADQAWRAYIDELDRTMETKAVEALKTELRNELLDAVGITAAG